MWDLNPGQMHTRTHVHSLQVNRQKEEHKETGELPDYPTLLPGFGKMTSVKPGPIYFLLLFILLSGVNAWPTSTVTTKDHANHPLLRWPHCTQQPTTPHRIMGQNYGPQTNTTRHWFFLKMSELPSTCYLFKGKKKLTSYCLSAPQTTIQRCCWQQTKGKEKMINTWEIRMGCNSSSWKGFGGVCYEGSLKKNSYLLFKVSYCNYIIKIYQASQE